MSKQYLKLAKQRSIMEKALIHSTFKNIGNRLHAHGNQLLLCKIVIKLFWASGNRLLPYGNRLPDSKKLW